MINVIVQVLQQKTTLLDGKRITKMYAADRADGINEDLFYQHMTNGTAMSLRALVSPLVGLPGVPVRPLVIVVVLEQASGGSKRKSRRTRKSKRKSHRR
jgi:hypothetical protein